MMFATLRMLGLLRRGVRALESLAASQRELAQVAQHRRLQRESRHARRPTKTQFDTLDIREAEKRWRGSRPEAAYSEDPPEPGAV